MTDRGNKYFLLYANCVPVQGYSRSSICDLQKNEMHLIPNSLYEILLHTRSKNISEIKCFYQKEDKTIDEYFDFLLENELGFLIDDLSWSTYFPPLQLHWDYPFDVSNCIIDLKPETDILVISRLARELDDLYCANLQIRFFNPSENLALLSEILTHFSDTTITNIEIITSGSFISSKDWKSFCDNNIKVTRLIVHSSEEDIITESDLYLTPIVFTSKIVSDVKHCGIINTDQYVINLTTFTESLHHNTCLNRKIAIDIDGNIKNCPSMPESFGNIKDTTLQEALAKPGFKKYWNIKKDEIAKCKDCEFRHVCTDCRAYLENPEDIYSAPLKCGYDPYTCTWEDWSINPLKQKAIGYYKMNF